MSRRGLDYVAQELLALLSSLHDFTSGLHLLGMLWSIRRVLILWILVPHGLLGLCGGVPEPLGNVKLSSKLEEIKVSV